MAMKHPSRVKNLTEQHTSLAPFTFIFSIITTPLHSQGLEKNAAIMQAGLLQTSTFDIQAEGQWSTEKGPFQQAIQGLLLTLYPKPPASIYLITQMCVEI